MGGASSIEGGKKSGQLTNKQIEDALRNEQVRESTTVKLLLLGPAESGKSTFAKQMKLLHSQGFSDEDRRTYRMLIFSNIIENTVTIVDAMCQLGVPLTTQQAQDDAKLVKTYQNKLASSMIHVQRELLEAVSRLYKDSGFIECMDRANEYQLGDSTKYYFEALERIMSADYLPTDQDILRTRLRTTGLIETRFSFKGYNFRMVDVGGQRSERRKWIHCFDNVTAIIFTASLSEYDQLLMEDQNVNRMHESLILFGSIINQECLKRATTILLLNKKDIFDKKIKSVPLKVCFPEYTGANDYEEASTYVQFKYENLRPHGRDLYVHRTNATDTNNINVVFEASMAAVLRKNLEDTGLF